MNSKEPPQNSASLELGDLLDPSSPYVLTVVLPAALLIMFGFRRAAVFWIMAAIVWNVGKRMI